MAKRLRGVFPSQTSSYTGKEERAPDTVGGIAKPSIAKTLVNQSVVVQKD